MECPEVNFRTEELSESDLHAQIETVLETLQGYTEKEDLPCKEDLRYNVAESSRHEEQSDKKDVMKPAELVSTNELQRGPQNLPEARFRKEIKYHLSNNGAHKLHQLAGPENNVEINETCLHEEDSTSGPSEVLHVPTSTASEELETPLEKESMAQDPPVQSTLSKVPSFQMMNSAQHPVTLSGPGPPISLNSLTPPTLLPSPLVSFSPPSQVRQSLGLLSLGRPAFLTESGRHSAEGEKPGVDEKVKQKLEVRGKDQERSRSAMGFIEAAACGRPNGNQKKPANELSLPHVRSKQQTAILNLRSGNFVRKDLPLILAALKEEVEKRPIYKAPIRRCKTPRSLRRLPPGTRLAENNALQDSPASHSKALLSLRDPNWGESLPLISPTKEIEQKMKERKEQQEAKVYGQLHDQQLENSTDILNSLGGELNAWLSNAQAKEAHLERLNTLWKGERDGLAKEAGCATSMEEEIKQINEKLEECALKKEATLLDKLGLDVLRRRLHDDMRQELTVVQVMRDKYCKVAGTCTALIEDIKRNHAQKEQAEADAAVIRKRILEARVDQEEKLAEERARRDTQKKLMADKEVAEARRKARVHEARQESLDAAKEAAVKTTQAVFATEIFKGNLKVKLIKLSAAFQRIVDATGLRDVNELVEHFRDPKERVEKWRAEKERAENKLAALKDELSKLKVVLGDFELEGYSTRLRWKEFDALESKQLNCELTYLHLRESVETARYRVQEAQASFETIANSVGISLSGIDLFKGKSVEPPPFLKPLESRPIALSAEMFGLQPGLAFQRLALAAASNSEGAARMFGEVASAQDAAETRGRATKGEPGPGLLYVPGPLNGIPPDTAVDIARVIRTLQLKVDRLLDVPAELSHGYELGQRRATVNLRAKEMRSMAFHKLMEALEWIPPQDRLPEKPKDAKEPIDKVAMSAAVSSYIASGIAAAAILPLPRQQLERFAVRICWDTAQGDVPSASHFPTFNERVHKRSSNLKTLTGLVTASGKLRKLSRQSSYSKSVGGSASNGSDEGETEPEEEDKAEESFRSFTEALVAGTVLPKNPPGKVKFERIDEETEPKCVLDSPQESGKIVRSLQKVTEEIPLKSLQRVSEEGESGKEIEEDTSIMGARKDQDVFRQKNQLFRARRETLLQRPEDPERTRRLEERYKNVMRFIPGLGQLESATLGLVGANTDDGTLQEGEHEKGVGKSVRWT